MTRAQLAAFRLYNATPAAQIHTHAQKTRDERRMGRPFGPAHWIKRRRQRAAGT